MVQKFEIVASQRGNEEIEHVCHPERKELHSTEEKHEDGNETKRNQGIQTRQRSRVRVNREIVPRQKVTVISYTKREVEIPEISDMLRKLHLVHPNCCNQ